MTDMDIYLFVYIDSIDTVGNVKYNNFIHYNF